MKLSNMSRKESTVGEMINLISINVQSLNEFADYVNILLGCMFSILVGTYLIWQQLGVASLAGLSAMIIIIPFNSYVSNECKKLQTKKLKETDARVKMTNEMLNGIKVIKLSAWEIPFKELITVLRNAELKILKFIINLNAISNLSWTLIPFLVSFIHIIR